MPDQNQPVILSTFADLIRHGYRLCGFCRQCGVHRDIDLSRCPPERSYIGALFKCRDCGSVAAITMSQIKTGSETFSPALEQWRTR